MIRRFCITVFVLGFAFSNVIIANDVPFHMIKGLMVVKATVENKTGMFIFDTGADHAILNSHNNFKGSDANFSTGSGDLSAQSVVLRAIKIGDMNQENLEAYKANLSKLDEYLGFDILGILPGAIFSPHYYLINYKEKVIEVYSKVNKEVKEGFLNTWSIKNYNNVPLLCSKANGKKQYFILDSGASTNYLSDDILNSDIDFSFTGIEKEIITTSGSSIAKEILVKNLDINEVAIKESLFFLMDTKKLSESIGKNIFGVINFNLLAKDRILVDVGNGKIYF